MPWSRPTLSDLVDQAKSDMLDAIRGSANALLRFANTTIIARVQAGLAHLHYGYIDWGMKQATPFTAEEEYLEGWAGLRNVFRNPATQATGTINFAGSNGVVLPSGTPVTRDDGLDYVTTGDGTVSSGSVTVPAECVEPGSAGNCDVGTAFTLGTAIAGIQSAGAAATAFTAGSDAQNDDSLRTEMLAAYQSPARGGARGDYIKWAMEVATVTRAWCVPLGSGAGTVDVYFMMDVSEAAFGGFPQGTDGVATDETRDVAAVGDQLIVADYIYPLRPVTALVYAKAPTAHTIAFTIAGLSGAGTDVQTAVAAAITDLFLREGTADGATIYLSDIEAAIVAVTGARGFIITTPSADISNTVGQLSVLGVITWT